MINGILRTIESGACIDHAAIARQIYRDLAGKPHGMVDWQVCDRYCLSATDFRAVIEASNGHLRLRQPGILEAVKPEP